MLGVDTERSLANCLDVYSSHEMQEIGR